MLHSQKINITYQGFCYICFGAPLLPPLPMYSIPAHSPYQNRRAKSDGEKVTSGTSTGEVSTWGIVISDWMFRLSL